MELISKTFDVHLSHFKDSCDLLILNLSIGVRRALLMRHYKLSLVNYTRFKIENVDLLVIGNIYCKLNYFLPLGL